ncbi:MAG: peptidylprolyl isomerase [Faecousia sp.]
MFCKYCGSALEDGVTVCPSCGKDNAEPVAPPKKKKEKKKISGKNAIVICLVLVVAAVLIALVMYGLSGGFTPKSNDIFYKDSYTVDESKVPGKMDDVVATMGTHQLTNAQLQVYYWAEIYSFLDYYGYYIYYFGLDTAKPMDEQIMDEDTGMTWEQYFLEQALSSWQRYMVLCDHAAEAGFEMDEESREYLTNLRSAMEEAMAETDYETLDEMLQAEYGSGCSFADYEAYLQDYYTANLYFSERYDRQEITEEELETYFTENEDTLKNSYGITKDSGKMVDYLYILVAPEGGTKDDDGNTTYSEAEWEAAKEKAQDIYDRWLSGEKTKDSFAALADELSADQAISADMAQYKTRYSQATVDIRHILIMPEGGTEDENGNITYSEEEWEAARVKAQQLLDDWIASGATEERFAELANEHSADKNGEVTDGGIYTNVKKNAMVTEFDAWIFADGREYGDNGIVKTQYGYHLMFFVHADRAVDDWVHEESRQAGDHTLVETDAGYEILYFAEAEEGWIRYAENGVRGEKSSAELKAWVAESTMTVRYKAIALAEHTLAVVS